MCALPVLLIFIFNYIPMAGLVLAFKNFRYDKGMFGSPWAGIDNFRFFFESDSFIKITRNTLGLNALFIFLIIVCSVALAVTLFRINSRRATKVYQTVLITPHFVSWVVAAYIVYALLNPQYGLINHLLVKFGIEPIDWYAMPKAWPAILSIAYIWKHIGLDSVIYYAALMGMDSSLIEAASVDGATRWQQTRFVIIPQLTVLIVIQTILKIGGIFRADFGMFYQLTRDVGMLYETTDVIDTFIFRTMRVVGNMGMSSAVGFLQSVVGFVLVMVTNYVSKKIDEDYGLF
ncbi:MAG: sugar ABC transporter permease [Clostridia bacterium]|nr:sugar ABC transporter permease [Clostridia bacterium]